jgi:polar amino acid transport system substrate-binding protein
MTRKALSTSVFVAITLLGATTLGAQTYKVALMELPSTPLYRDLTVAIGEEAGVKLEIQVVPVARAIGLVESRQVDLECPQLVSRNAERLRNLPFDYSTEIIYESAFVLYTNKAKPVDLANLKGGNSRGYVIETDLSNLSSFEFTGSPTTNLEGSLRKVDSGAIDGFIFSQTVGDPIVKRLGLTNIRRQLYDNFPLVYALQKGGRGGPVDRMLTAGLARLRANGRLEKLIGEYARASKYVDWQP